MLYIDKAKSWVSTHVSMPEINRVSVGFGAAGLALGAVIAKIASAKDSLGFFKKTVVAFQAPSGFVLLSKSFSLARVGVFSVSLLAIGGVVAGVRKYLDNRKQTNPREEQESQVGPEQVATDESSDASAVPSAVDNELNAVVDALVGEDPLEGARADTVAPPAAEVSPSEAPVIEDNKNSDPIVESTPDLLSVVNAVMDAAATASGLSTPVNKNFSSAREPIESITPLGHAPSGGCCSRGKPERIVKS